MARKPARGLIPGGGSFSYEALVDTLLCWFRLNARDLPWRRTTDPYAIWVSEIMLQQTQVATVWRYWERWMQALPTLRDLAQASPRKIHKLWEGLGYYTRVRNMQWGAKIIVRQYGGKFPDRYEEVLALPGIGRYTAGAICSIAFHQPTPILDGNVTRVLCRLFAIEGNPRERATNAVLWNLAADLVQTAAGLRKTGDTGSRASSRVSSIVGIDQGRGGTRPYQTGIASPVSAFNQSLMELGALICTPANPRCAACPVAAFCVAERSGRTAVLPNLVKRPKPTRRRFVAFILQHGQKFLVRQRPAGVVNAHLWEFPNLEVALRDGAPRKAAARLFGIVPDSLQPFCQIRHTITRFRITLDVFKASLPADNRISLGGKWLTPSRLCQLPFASAHKRILDLLNRVSA